MQERSQKTISSNERAREADDDIICGHRIEDAGIISAIKIEIAGSLAAKIEARQYGQRLIS
jgi:hypothetical protein